MGSSNKVSVKGFRKGRIVSFVSSTKSGGAIAGVSSSTLGIRKGKIIHLKSSRTTGGTIKGSSIEDFINGLVKKEFYGFC